MTGEKQLKKGILTVLTSAVLVLISGALQAASLAIVPRNGVNGELMDGMKIATGQVICREAHTGFLVWMNAQHQENNPGHYIILGQKNDRHELRVRIGGEGWSPSVVEGHEGTANYSQNEQVVFDVVVDGNQHVAQDEYVYSVTGACS